MSQAEVDRLRRELARTQQELASLRQLRVRELNAHAREIRLLGKRLRTPGPPRATLVPPPFQGHHDDFAAVVSTFERNRVTLFRDLWVRREALYHRVERPAPSDWNAADYVEDEAIQVEYAQLLDIIEVLAPDHHLHL